MLPRRLIELENTNTKLQFDVQTLAGSDLEADEKVCLLYQAKVLDELMVTHFVLRLHRHQ